MRKSSPLWALLTATLLAACARSSPAPQDSGVDVPMNWIRQEAPLATDASAGVEHDWWHRFSDPTLDSLIGKALAVSFQ